MEQPENTTQMLDLIASPAFSVENGVVTARNRAAAQYMIESGCPIGQLLAAGQDEYEAFQDGCLYLQLSVFGHRCGASITRVEGRDIFVLEDAAESESLRSLALAARELRTPLSGILSTVDRLFPVLEAAGDAAAQEQLALINRNLFQMLRMVGNMSDAVRYSTESKQNLETANICAVIQEIFDQASVLAETAGVTIRLRNLPQGVYCAVDREMLERAVYNLLSNAIRSSPKGSCIAAEVTRHGKRLYLSIQDSGSGIPNDILGSIFTRFARAPGIEDGRQGIGLGMLLVRSAAIAHNGTVLIRQTEQGTKITLSVSLTDLSGSTLRSPVLKIDYAGERSHGLIELSDVLPASAYSVSEIN